MTHVTVSLI